MLMVFRRCHCSNTAQRGAVVRCPESSVAVDAASRVSQGMFQFQVQSSRAAALSSAQASSSWQKNPAAAQIRSLVPETLLPRCASLSQDAKYAVLKSPFRIHFDP